MTYMLNDIDEAIDRKFLVTKTMSNQVPAGTIVHIMGADSNKDGSITVYYRITYTRQDYTIKFDSLKSFCKWARPDNFIARHYESFNTKEIQRYIKIKDRNFTNFCLPMILIALIAVWAAVLFVMKGSTGAIVLGAVASVVMIILIMLMFKTSKQKAMTKLYSKVSAKSNWGVRFK
ncbi:MAG: hypothetical protein IKQ39_05180 [Oscillospiraceae bacterium]|nr:hypothetical protein [Oscillospiraceae bacterium]